MWQIYPHPIEWQFHRFWFLFWQLIFGRSGVADLPPCHRMAISQILIPILTAHIWLTRCGRSTPCRTAISQILIPILTAHIWPTRCGRSTPTHRMAISQILIPILTAHIWQTRCGRSTPNIRMAMSQILISILTAHIWPTRGGRSTPCRTAISQILIPILTAHIWPTRCDRSTPTIEWQFHRFWFLFWQLIFGRPGVADLPPPHRMAISQILIPILTAHIWPTRCGRSTPTPIEWQFHRFWFLFWQLIFGRPGVADLPPPNRMAISQILIPILTAHIWQTRCGRSTPTQ